MLLSAAGPFQNDQILDSHTFTFLGFKFQTTFLRFIFQTLKALVFFYKFGLKSTGPIYVTVEQIKKIFMDCF